MLDITISLIKKLALFTVEYLIFNYVRDTLESGSTVCYHRRSFYASSHQLSISIQNANRTEEIAYHR